MSVEFVPGSGRTHYAIRGAAAFGLTAILVFAFSAWYAPQTDLPLLVYFLAVGPLCGIIGGLAYGPRIALPIVLASSLSLVAAMFMLQDASSPLLSNVVWTGFTAAFLFWSVGACATLALPRHMRFNGARAFAVPGLIAGILFQFLYGPARSLFDISASPWLETSGWEHLVLWLVAGIGGGWLFGAGLDRMSALPHVGETPAKNYWAVSAVVLGAVGLLIGMIAFTRSSLPLDLPVGLSPAAGIADWLWSWGLLASGISAMAVREALRRRPFHRGHAIAAVAVVLSVALIYSSRRMEAGPWKATFNAGYAQQMLSEHASTDDPEYPQTVYTANLILAQSALDSGDSAAAGRHLLDAATTPGFPELARTGPDTNVARVLLQQGEQAVVLEYLNRSRSFWSQGGPVIDRWVTAIQEGRQPNFNNRNARGGGGGGGGGGQR